MFPKASLYQSWFFPGPLISTRPFWFVHRYHEPLVMQQHRGQYVLNPVHSLTMKYDPVFKFYLPKRWLPGHTHTSLLILSIKGGLCFQTAGHVTGTVPIKTKGYLQVTREAESTTHSWGIHHEWCSGFQPRTTSDASLTTHTGTLPLVWFYSIFDLLCFPHWNSNLHLYFAALIRMLTPWR